MASFEVRIHNATGEREQLSIHVYRLDELFLYLDTINPDSWPKSESSCQSSLDFDD
jgi:hypothetical protein